MKHPQEGVLHGALFVILGKTSVSRFLSRSIAALIHTIPVVVYCNSLDEHLAKIAQVRSVLNTYEYLHFDSLSIFFIQKRRFAFTIKKMHVFYFEMDLDLVMNPDIFQGINAGDNCVSFQV